MHFSAPLIVAAVMVGESMAGPVHAHRHAHAHAHAKKDVDWDSLNWNKLGIDWTSAWAAGQAKTSTAAAVVPTAAPIIAAQVKKPATTTTSASSVEATPSTSSISSISSSSSSSAEAAATKTPSSSNVETLFSKIKGLADDLTAFGSATLASGEIVGKIGNIGSPQGSNMIKVDAVGDHKYTNTFENTSGEPITIAIWNKAYSRTGHAADAEANLGSCIAPKSPALSITLGPHESQVVAFQEDTQAGWAQATTDIALSGAYATTWAEINYISTGCGYDVSSIMNVHGNSYDMAMSALETECISDMTQNLWIGRNDNPEDPIPVGNSDGSCFIPAGKCTVHTKMGGQKS